MGKSMAEPSTDLSAESGTFKSRKGGFRVVSHNESGWDAYSTTIYSSISTRVLVATRERESSATF